MYYKCNKSITKPKYFTVKYKTLNLQYSSFMLLHPLNSVLPVTPFSGSIAKKPSMILERANVEITTNINDKNVTICIYVLYKG